MLLVTWTCKLVKVNSQAPQTRIYRMRLLGLTIKRTWLIKIGNEKDGEKIVV
jgi:hypothetical protein